MLQEYIKHIINKLWFITFYKINKIIYFYTRITLKSSIAQWSDYSVLPDIFLHIEKLHSILK